MKTTQFDLNNCDREPIHIPGHIQSHGFLVAVESETGVISFVSENCNAFLGTPAADLLDKTVAVFEQLTGIESGRLTALISIGQAAGGFETINPFPLVLSGTSYYLILSAAASRCLLEFEPVVLEYDLQQQIGKSISGILSGRNTRALLEHTAIQIKEIIHYDRVMIYKFLEDGHGEVVAEMKNEDLEPFLGLHYPASDIPKQARELYKLNYTRIISDVSQPGSALLGHQSGEPLDLTHSGLRAVSPIHIQYLKNMGVASSFSISLVVQGELWGLVACHNYSPRFIDYKAREASKLIGKIVSSALEYREEEELEELSGHHQVVLNMLNEYLSRDEHLASALTGHEYTLKDILEADGVALSFDGQLRTLGITPDEGQLTGLLEWLKRSMDDAVYYTHSLPEVFHPAKAYADTGSGIMVCMLSKELNEMIVWFRKAHLSSIKWAGEPEKAAIPGEQGLMNLSPRRSFEIFSQLVENTAVKWSKRELANVMKLRERILSAITRKAGEIRTLNDKLKHAYEELDTFSYTISHDLRTPLTAIKSYTELVMVTNKSLDESGRKLLERVVAGADKMNFLINEILKLARAGRAEMEVQELDMDTLVRETAREVISGSAAEHLSVSFGPLPPVCGSAILIGQVFMNLISNAVKYSSGGDQPKIHIQGEVTGEETIYQVTDNGIGIQMDHQNKVFELFKRMDNVKDIPGSGVGLAIVKRIVEKHGARIWFESELKAGTIFYIAFKNNLC